MANSDNMQIESEKLIEDNFHAWKFKITNFLKEKGYWDYIEGANEEALEIPPRNATLEQAKLLKE